MPTVSWYCSCTGCSNDLSGRRPCGRVQGGVERVLIFPGEPWHAKLFSETSCTDASAFTSTPNVFLFTSGLESLEYSQSLPRCDILIFWYFDFLQLLLERPAIERSSTAQPRRSIRGSEAGGGGLQSAISLNNELRRRDLSDDAVTKSAPWKFWRSLKYENLCQTCWQNLVRSRLYRHRFFQVNVYFAAFFKSNQISYLIKSTIPYSWIFQNLWKFGKRWQEFCNCLLKIHQHTWTYLISKSLL